MSVPSAYPVTESELEAIANGDLHQVRYQNGWTTIHPETIADTDPADPPDELLEELAREPGLSPDTALEYLQEATADHTAEQTHHEHSRSRGAPTLAAFEATGDA